MGDKLICRSVYNKPLSKMVGQSFKLTPEQMKKSAKIILEEVRREIRYDASKHNAMARLDGQPVPIPNTKEFVMSFKTIINGSKIEVVSDWPFVEQHLEGKNRFAMSWLTQLNGVDKVPMITRQGVVLIRTAPLSKEKAWIHPGFLKYNFLERGVQKGRERAAEMLIQELILPALTKVDLLR